MEVSIAFAFLMGLIGFALLLQLLDLNDSSVDFFMES